MRRDVNGTLPGSPPSPYAGVAHPQTSLFATEPTPKWASRRPKLPYAKKKRAQDKHHLPALSQKCKRRFRNGQDGFVLRSSFPSQPGDPSSALPDRPCGTCDPRQIGPISVAGRRPVSCSEPSLGPGLVDGPRLSRHIVHEEILAERVRCGEVGLAAAHLGDLLHELNQAKVGSEHKGIDHYAGAFAA